MNKTSFQPATIFQDTSVFYFSNLPSSRACPERKGVESNDAMKVLKNGNLFTGK